ncbi:hypothetical protein B566_EDAN019057 [Ephemera danica]|nr:hypothetical protein B566_EDAN019057 [Ephemera danica]
MRSQESGFEEDPELWRGWPDSSRSTPLLDWPQESEWTSQPSAQCWTPQWRSETPTPTASVVPAPSAVVHSASMPTIIRSKPSKQCAKKEDVAGDESPPMPNFPPPLPPPNLDDDLIVTCSYPTTPMPWKAVALYDFPATHPDDLPLKVGDQVEILSQVDENWFQGRVEWNAGNFPACFVHVLQ